MTIRPDSVEHETEPTVGPPQGGKPAEMSVEAMPAEAAGAPPAAVSEMTGPPTREGAAASATGAPEVVVPSDPAHATGEPPRVEPLFETAAEAPAVAAPEAAEASAAPGRDRKESRAAALAASAAALTPPRRRRWVTVRRVIGYGLAAVFLGWLAGLASASSIFGSLGGDDAATGRSAAVASADPAAAPAAMSAEQFAALQSDIRGLRREVESLRGEISRARHETRAKLADPTPAAALSAKQTPPPPATKADAPSPAAAGSADAVAQASTGSVAAAKPLAGATANSPADQPLVTASIGAPTVAPALPQPPPAGLKEAAARAKALPAPRVALRGSRDGNDAASAHVLRQFSLRGVARGRALVERRDGRLQEVAVGDYLPGAGRVDAISRRHGAWVVVVERGLIVSSLY